MLRSMKDLKNYTIQASDGEIGKLTSLFFDQKWWQVRYLVIDVGSWIFGREVLISPTAVSHIDAETKILTLNLTKESIKNSPGVSTDAPISRQKEAALHTYYHWQPYWTVRMHDPMLQGAFLHSDSDTLDLENQTIQQKKGETTDGMAVTKTESDSGLRSTNEVNGYQIQASDGEIGHVADFLIDDKAWFIRHLVVNTGNWLSGRQVLVAPPWIKKIRWAEKSVYFSLTQDSVRNSPPFDPDLLDIETYEEQMLNHYQSWFSYLLQTNQGKGETTMFLGKAIMGNPVITVSNGRSIGKARDVYLTEDCHNVAAIYLGTEGLFSRESFLVKSEDVVTIGQDAVLVKNPDVIQEEKTVPEAEETWLRRDDLQGRPVDTPGGTKVGKIGDVVINNDGKVLGFSLSQVYVDGPIAENRSIAIHTVQDMGHKDGVMTINLKEAEYQELSVV
jgi:uncharacterized protein YrrD